MKLFLLLMISGCTGIFGEVIPEWSTVSGKHYQNVELLKVEPDGISIRHENGVAKVSYHQLTKEQRSKFNLTLDGRDSYVREKQEEERIALEFARLNVAAPPAAVVAGDVPYTTPGEIRGQWLSRVKFPSPLSKNYRTIYSQCSAYVQDLKSGARNRDLEERAAQINRELALKAGDSQRAELEAQTLARIERIEADIARQAQDELYRRQQLEAMRACAQPPPQPVVCVSPDPVVVNPCPSSTPTATYYPPSPGGYCPTPGPGHCPPTPVPVTPPAMIPGRH